MMFVNTVEDIREQFAALYHDGEFVIDKTGCKVLEIVGASFIADEESIFGAVNHDYVKRELEWYKSMSLYVNDIPGDVPKIWKDIACKNGRINSNYGNLIYSKDNFSQYENVLNELKKNPDSRRATMVYNRPSIWKDYNENGRSDFICTNAVQYILRNGKLNAIVQMRSNDAWAGYRNDFHWQKYVLQSLANELSVDVGDIHWCVGSLHIYERQFYLVDHYVKTGEIHISKDEYDRSRQVAQ